VRGHNARARRRKRTRERAPRQPSESVIDGPSGAFIPRRGGSRARREIDARPATSWQHSQHLNFRWELDLKGNEACILGFDCAVALSALNNGGGRERDSIRADPTRARRLHCQSI